MKFLWLTLLFFAGVVLFLFQPAFWPQFNRAFVDYGYDQISILYNYHRLSENLLHFHHPLFDGKMIFPTTDNLLYSDSMPLSGLIYRGLLALSDTKVTAFNLVQLLFFALNFASLYWLARRFFASWISAILAMVFCFSQIRIAQIDHPHCIPQFFFPLFAGFLLQFERGENPRRALWGMGICWGLQFYFSMTLGIILSVTCLPYLIARVLSKETRARYTWPLLKMTLIAALLATPILGAYALVSARHGFSRGIAEAGVYSANPKSYFVMAPSHPYAPFIVDTLLGGENGARQEKNLFIGFAALILAYFGIRHFNRTTPRGPRKIFYATLIFVILVSMGRNSGFYQLLYYTFPLIRGLRTPAKFSMSYLFLMTLLIGFGLQWLQQRYKGRGQRVVLFGGLALLAVVDNRIPLAIFPMPTHLHEVVAFLQKTPDRDAILFLPFERENPHDNNFELTRMFFALDQSHPMGNGSVGFRAPSRAAFQHLGIELAEKLEPSTLDEIKNRGIRYLILEHAKFVPEHLAGLQVLLAAEAKRVHEDPYASIYDLAAR